MEKINVKNKFCSAISLLCVFVFFSVIYSVFVAPLYGYMGFELAWSFEKFLTCIFFVFLLSFVLKTNGSTSSFFLRLCILIVIIPSFILVSCAGEKWGFLFLNLFAFVFLYLSSRIKFKSVGFDLISSCQLINLVLGFGFVILVFNYYKSGRIEFNLAHVYEFREELNLKGGYFLNLLTSYLGKVLIPFALVLSFLKRKYFKVFVFILYSLFLFLLTSHKAYFILPIIVLVICFFISEKDFFKPILKIFIICGCVTLFEFYVFNTDSWPNWFGSMFFRRGLMLPSLLSSYHFEFFQVNDFAYWANSKLTFGLLDYKYNVGIPQIIGGYFYEKEEMSANVGWIGSGYAHAGYFGVFIYSVVMGWLLAFFDSQERRFGYKFLVPGVFLFFILIINTTDLVTSMISHGGGVLIFLLISLKAEKFN